MKTSGELLKEAMSALLKGDTAGRDRFCKEAEAALKREEREKVLRAEAKIMQVDFYVFADGRAVSSKRMYAAAH
jgi:hypothetical protein